MGERCKRYETCPPKPCPEGFSLHSGTEKSLGCKNQNCGWQWWSCRTTNKKCFEMGKVQGMTALKNRCISGSINDGQVIFQCSAVASLTTRCNAVMDWDQTTTVNFVAGGHLTLQYTTPRMWSSVRIFRPPTSGGGTKTMQQNVWHFKVVCFVGTGKTIGAGAWHTLLDTKHEDVRITEKPGWSEYVINKQCPKQSDTWRIQDMSPILEKTPYLTLNEIRFDVAKDNRPGIQRAAQHPTLTGVRMSIPSGSKTITTQFLGADFNLKCPGMSQTRPELRPTLNPKPDPSPDFRPTPNCHLNPNPKLNPDPNLSSDPDRDSKPTLTLALIMNLTLTLTLTLI